MNEVTDVEFTETITAPDLGDPVEAVPEVPEYLMAQNFGIQIAANSPILENDHVARFIAQVGEYMQVQEDGSVLFPLLHTDLAYFLHLVFVTSGRDTQLVLDGVLVHEDEDGQKYQIQIAKLSYKDE